MNMRINRRLHEPGTNGPDWRAEAQAHMTSRETVPAGQLCRVERIILIPGAIAAKCPFCAKVTNSVSDSNLRNGIEGGYPASPDRKLSFSGLPDLTFREEQILAQVARGLTNKEIAVNLRLTEPTVKKYMTAVMEKLQVRNRVEAVLTFQKMKMVGAVP
jgi:DNA-binding NarL/FixJ family response regulator